MVHLTEAVGAVVGTLSWIVFMIIEKTMGNRATDKTQIQGLDLHETGIEAYAQDNALHSVPAKVPALIPPPLRSCGPGRAFSLHAFDLFKSAAFR